MKVQIVTAPATEPVSLSEARDQLRLINPGTSDSREGDNYILQLITAARQHVEHITGRVFVEQTWDLWLDDWPGGGGLFYNPPIEIPYPPLQSVTSLTYTDVDQTGYTLTEGVEFTVDTDSEPGRIVLDYDETWPSEQLHPNNPIKIRFVAGYADGATPAPIKHAIKILIAHLDANRALIDNSRGRAETMMPVPMSMQALLAPYRMYRL